MKKISFLLLIQYFLFTTITAQTRFVEVNELNMSDDSIECLQDISVYSEFQKMKLYDEAIPAWAKAYQRCKGFKKVIYQDGVKFLVYLIKKEKDIKKKKVLVDSLMHIYQERIKYFGEEGYVKGRQGIDLLRYDQSKLEEAHKLLKESFELEKNNTGPAVLVTFMITTDALYKRKKITKDEFVNNYMSLIETVEGQISEEKKPSTIDNLKKALAKIEDIFGKNAPDCKSITQAFKQKFDERKDQLEQVLKIQAVLKGANCISDSLYFDVSVQALKLEPTAERAYLIAGLQLKKEKYTESINYLQQAIDLETNDSLKAGYYHDMGFIYCHKLKQYQQARTKAIEATKLRPNWGNPYLLIGDAYALSSASFSNDNFQKATVFWVAVDKYYKAKSLDPSVEKLASQKIAYYSAYFPKKEDAFMLGLTDGQNYKIEGWINESTTVKTKN